MTGAENTGVQLHLCLLNRSRGFLFALLGVFIVVSKYIRGSEDAINMTALSPLKNTYNMLTSYCYWKYREKLQKFS